MPFLMAHEEKSPEHSNMRTLRGEVKGRSTMVKRGVRVHRAVGNSYVNSHMCWQVNARQAGRYEPT